MKHKTEIIAEAGSHDLFIRRAFDAPVTKVFQAFTNPDLLIRWFMPPEQELRVVAFDCRTSGQFQLKQKGGDDQEYGFYGVFHEVTAPSLIVRTSEFQGLPQKLEPVLEFTRFLETGNGTLVEIHSICPSVEYRDQMINAGMKPTLEVTHSLLDKLLQSPMITVQ